MKALLFLLWHLSICLPALAIDLLPPPPYDEATDLDPQLLYPTRSYVTEEEIKSPRTNFRQWSQECDDGLLYFITPRGHSLPSNRAPRPGPMILDRRGELVWTHHFANKFGGEAYNFLVQQYKGEDYLSFWLGDDRVRGHGAGFYYLLNSSYDEVFKVGGANGLSADLHEFLMLPEGTALMTLYEIVPGDVSMFRDFNPDDPLDQEPNYIWDGVVQEIDIETGELVFEWRASEHVEFTETYRPIYRMGTKNDPFDWFHINSIQKDEFSNYLVSARYPHSLTYIDGKTKETIWQLGGKLNSFMDLSGGNATNFAWQHDARVYAADTFPNLYTPPPEQPGMTTKLLTVFDNAAEDQHFQFGVPLSRGLLLEVRFPTPGTEKAKTGPVGYGEERLPLEGEYTEDEKKFHAIQQSDPDYTVRVVKSYENPLWIRASSQGSVQLLPQGKGLDPKVFVGYGLTAAWTEFAANGTVLCDVHYGAKTSWDTGHIQSYRNYKQAWVGRPRTNPSVEITDDDMQVFVSWNGATDVVEWVLQCSQTQSEDEKAWSDLARVPKHTFETIIPVPDNLGDIRYLRVIALAENDRRLDYGTSKIIDRGIMASYFPAINHSLPPEVHHVSAQLSAELSPLKIFLIIASGVSLFFVIYELSRKCLSWRRGQSTAGALRFRNNVLYKLIADV